MSRSAKSILVILVLLAVLLDTVVEAKKGKRHWEEKRQNIASKRHESSLKSKEGKGMRSKEDKLKREIKNKYLEITIDDLQKRVRGGKQVEVKERFPEVNKKDMKNFREVERVTSGLNEGEAEETPEECEYIEHRSERYGDESKGLEKMEDEDPQEECLSVIKVNKQKKKSRCVHDRTLFAHEESAGNCYYGL